MPELPEIHLFLPQMRQSMEELVGKAQAAERAGFAGIALMDHLAPPLAESQPMYEAMTTAAWLAAHTQTLQIGHLVLCDALRHPAVLARQAVTLDDASGGRFELGLGWGSMAEELVTFGITTDGPAARVERLRETLDVLALLWTGEAVDHDGRHVVLRRAQQQPTPSRRIPIVIGGIGPRTMELVAEYADWWNIPTYGLARLEELRPRAGRARPSVQLVVAFVRDGAVRDDVLASARRRFGAMAAGAMVAGSADEIREALAMLRQRGVERAYLWFTDFAPAATLHEFGDGVLHVLKPR